jgi:hypothetical protein
MATEISGINGHAEAGTRYPSDDRRYPGSAFIEPVVFPKTCSDETIDCRSVADKLVTDFNRFLVAKDGASLAALVHDRGSWRDHICLSWDLRTFTGPAAVAKQLANGCRLLRLEIDDTVPYRAPAISNIDVDGTVRGVRFFATVATDVGAGSAVVRLVEDKPGEWKIFTLYTVLEKLNDFPENVGVRRSRGTEQPGGKNWLQQRTEQRAFSNSGPAVLIIGETALCPCSGRSIELADS